MSTMKQLDIRIGAVKRLTKEMTSRRVDVETEKKRKERFISEGEDQWTVAKQQEVIAEAEKMIPDAQQRLEAGLTDVKALLEAMDNEVSSEKKSQAETVIQEGETAIQG